MIVTRTSKAHQMWSPARRGRFFHACVAQSGTACVNVLTGAHVNVKCGFKQSKMCNKKSDVDVWPPDARQPLEAAAITKTT